MNGLVYRSHAQPQLTMFFERKRETMKDLTAEQIEKLTASVATEAVIAEALGWTAYAETRGRESDPYAMAVAIRPGDREPWKEMQNSELHAKRYKRIPCLEAVGMGFHGISFPAYTRNRSDALLLWDWLEGKGLEPGIYKSGKRYRFKPDMRLRTMTDQPTFELAISIGTLLYAKATGNPVPLKGSEE